MRRAWFILLLLGLSACIRVDFSEGPTPMARYVCRVDWGLPAGVEPTAADTVAPLYVALARTTQTIHDTCHILIPSLDTVIRDSVPKGDYHAIAFGGPIDAPDQNDNTDKFYRLDNYDDFYGKPTTVGLADISLLLPPEPAGGNVDTSDPNVLCLEHLRQSAPFPVVQQARPVWLASDYRSLESGETVNAFQFAMQKMMQELTLRIRIDLPAALLRLFRNAFLIIGNAIQLQHAFTADGSAIQRAGLHRRRHRIADQTIAAIQPDIRFERFASDCYATIAENFTAARIHHGSRDFILVVAIAKQFFRHGGIDRNFHGSIWLQLLLQIHDDFGSFTAETAVIPTPTWRTATPLRPAGIPWAVRPEPPIAVSIIPIPWADRPPFRFMCRTQDFDFGRAFRNRSTEIVFRFDRQFELVAELRSLFRRINGHFEFRLLVFLHAEHA